MTTEDQDEETYAEPMPPTLRGLIRDTLAYYYDRPREGAYQPAAAGTDLDDLADELADAVEVHYGTG